jgi:hypothetical protein
MIVTSLQEICEARVMQVAKWNTVRSYFDSCVAGRAECSGKQMRNGFVVLNLVVWAVILAGIQLLT